jgi:hypothetical protein
VKKHTIFCLLNFVFLLVLGGCTGSGYSNAWVPSSQSRKAQEAPSKLLYPASKINESRRGNNYGSVGYKLKSNEVQSVPLEEFRRAGRESNYSPYSRIDNQYGLKKESRYLDNYGGATQDKYGTREQSGPEMHAPVGKPRVRVGLLLPLSGDKKDIGQAMLNATQIALFDVGSSDFELVPRDTKGTPEGARKAAESAAKSGAKLLLGPVFAKSVETAKPVADRYGINMIAFSTDWTLADNNTFIMGFLPFAQVQRLSEYASQKGLHRIGIISPNNLYGNVVIRTFREYARLNGLETADVVKYNPLQKDLSPAIRTFTDYEQRAEMLNRQKELVKQHLEASPDDNKARMQLEELEKMTSFGDIPFDAVFMPMGGEQARTLASLLSYYDLGPEKVKRLGTGLWDDHSLATEPHLQGAWFAAPSPSMRVRFEKRYSKLYGNNPPRLASLAYDGTALASVLARKGIIRRGKPAFDRQDLINPNGFAGIDGIFRFRPDGLIERGLAVLEYRDGTIKIIDPAPKTFEYYGKS